METPGHQFLSRTIRPHNQHPRVGRRHLRDDVLHVADRLRLPYHLLSIDLLLEGLVLRDDRGLLRSVLDRYQDPVQIQRLLDVVKGSLLDAFHSGVNVTVSGNHDDGGVDALGHHLVQHLGTVHPRHLDVAEDHVVLLLVHHREGCHSVLRHIHFIALVTQNLLQGVPDGSFIINNQYLHRNSPL